MRSILLLILLAVGGPAGAAAVPLAMSGMPSPLGLPLSTLGGVSLMEDGSAAFLAASTGAFRRAGDALVRILAAGDQLADGRTVAGVSAPALGPGGCVAVRAFLVDGGSRILRRCGAATDVVASTGEAAPGGGEAAREYLIGFSQCNNAEPWREAMNKAAAQRAKDYPGIRVVFSDAENDAAKTALIQQLGPSFLQAPDLAWALDMPLVQVADFAPQVLTLEKLDAIEAALDPAV